ncbi:FecR family protein [Blastopirellula sp. JC732]|uniref:FecR family protein n=1 Tax=Blastopirellula sediminis TaxID=2894196 RepID=A0A9X1MSY8_9BACT|nr:FecR domain-containing protein [Blastopirellula sediminis]MCC9604682.1 FecR family protein [Blastopirellula sediminis]MCC9632019.1 FecR family protein [Blastopirellula sediminis]
MNSRRAVQGKLVANAAVLDLIDLCLTDRATPDQWKTLSQLIVDEPLVRDCFAAQAIASSRLAMIAGFEVSPAEPVATRLAAELATPVKRSWSPRLPKVQIPVSRAALVTLAAGVMLVLVGYGALVGYQSWVSSGVPTANLASGGVPAAVRIFNVAGETEPREFHGTEVFELPSGSYQAETSAGARIQLTGPIRVRVESPLAWRLFYGKMIADVPPEGYGFTIQTNQAKVIDLGTKFGVAVDRDGDTKVVVYEGNVELVSGRKKKSLTVGDAWTVPTTEQFEPLTFSDPVTFLEAGDIPPSVIGKVMHNGVDRRATYQIVRAGFQEDALAYTDRVHQWNGILSSGLPPQLLGLDYVRMANDWKFDANDSLRDDLEITYEFNRPAVAYLLVDERLAKPPWLRQNFRDTGWVIGLDKGSHHDPETRLSYELDQAKGAGASIDVLLRVWRVVLPEGGELKIGPIGNQKDDWVVPCLVARPI